MRIYISLKHEKYLLVNHKRQIKTKINIIIVIKQQRLKNRVFNIGHNILLMEKRNVTVTLENNLIICRKGFLISKPKTSNSKSGNLSKESFMYKGTHCSAIQMKKEGNKVFDSKENLLKL